MKFITATTLCSLLAADAIAQPTLVWKRAGAANNAAAANTAAGSGAACAVSTNVTAGQASVATNVTAGVTAAAGNATTTALVLPDGRIKQNAVATDFDVLASVFKSAVVKGDGTSLGGFWHRERL